MGRELRRGCRHADGCERPGLQPPFKFTGTLDKLTLTIDKPKLTPEDIKLLKIAMHNNPTSE